MDPSFNNGNSLFDFVVRDGNGVKGLTDLGISVVPERYIQPPEERIDKQNAISHRLAPIDLSKLDGPAHEQVVEEMGRAAETLGFFQVVNHGVPVELLESLKDAAHNFFRQTSEKKAIYRKGVSPIPSVMYGTSFALEKEKALEWKDYIGMAYTCDADALQYWPMECKEVALEYLKKTTNMVRKIVEILIGKIGVTLDDSRVNALVDSKTVNMNFYPACPNPELTLAIGRHSDIGTLTVLLQDRIGGLYVKLEEDIDAANKGSEWVEIPPTPGAFVINVGDVLQIVSNGRYKSAEHRVRTSSNESRVSIPVFTMPKLSEKIGPLPQVVERDGVARYREVVFQEYKNNFFGSAHQGKRSLDFTKP
ncbi:scopoletin 8-hydroxylase-like [Alnus glutinosa]|uniref:scopoletin 8-hydroxylase-like n=1 Tax=Alnus glutinosa TaxID=3517 RepID=UPI002D78D41D|nr:scopoletin 8-hydroxylase-like [Alnus glutinosa]